MAERDLEARFRERPIDFFDDDRERQLEDDLSLAHRIGEARRSGAEQTGAAAGAKR